MYVCMDELHSLTEPDKNLYVETVLFVLKTVSIKLYIQYVQNHLPELLQ